jgi:hypothetical protein
MASEMWISSRNKRRRLLLEQLGKSTIIRCWSSSEGDVSNRQSSKNKRTRVDTEAKKENKRWKRWEKTNK